MDKAIMNPFVVPNAAGFNRRLGARVVSMSALAASCGCEINRKPLVKLRFLRC